MDTVAIPDRDVRAHEARSPSRRCRRTASIKTYSATGKLTLHGTTKTVTIPLKTQRTGDVIQVQGILSITFPDYGIDNPSGGPASVGDVGQMEFVLQLQPLDLQPAQSGSIGTVRARGRGRAAPRA